MYSPGDLSPELSRPFRGFRLWLPLQLGGVSAFRSALEEKAALCRYSYRAFQSEPHFEVGPPPELSIHLFRYAPPVLLMFLFYATITYISYKYPAG